MLTHNLSILPPEILLTILSYLDISDLHALTLTSSPLRALACDPLLHLQRLRRVPPTLTLKLRHRPSRRSLAPPNAPIYLTRTAVLSRRISRSLVKIRVNHALSLRPPATDLILHNVLPSSYRFVAPRLIATSLDIQRQHTRAAVGRKLEKRPSARSLVQRCILPPECRPGMLSPMLVEARRRVMRERLKDGLSRWIQGRGVLAQRERSDAREAGEGERVSVRAVVRRLQARSWREREREMAEHSNHQTTAERYSRSSVHSVAVEMEKKRAQRAQRAWGAEAESEKRQRARNQPARAHVLGLKRFWEGVIRTAAA